MSKTKILTLAQNPKFLFCTIVPPALVLALAFLPGKVFAREADLSANFWILLANLLFILSSLWFSKKSIINHIKNNMPSKTSWALSLVVILLGAFVLFNTIEARHRVQSDESVFFATAQNLLYNQKAGACDEAFFQQGTMNCLNSAANFKTKGFPFLIALGIPLFGSNLSWVFALQAAMYLFTLILFFHTTYLWTRSYIHTIGALSFLAFCPTILFQFRSASVEPMYVLFSILALWLLHFCSNSPNSLSKYLLFGSVIGLFAQTRQETLFCIPAIGLFAAYQYLSKNGVTKIKPWLGFITTSSIFTLPILFTISHYRGYNFQGGQYQAHAFSNFVEHLKINWGIMTATLPWEELKTPFMGSFTWLALFGLIALLVSSYYNKNHRLWLLFIALYHAQTYGILENISGDFTIHINQRYALVFLPTMAFCIGFFMQSLWQNILPFFLKAKPTTNTLSISLLSLLTVLIAFSLTYRHRNEMRDNIMYKNNHLTNEESLIHKWIKQQEKPASLYIYARPWHFTGYGYSAIHYSRWASLSKKQKTSFLKQGNVYYIRGMDCWDSKTYHRKAVETRRPKSCDKFERNNSLDLIHQESVIGSYQLKIHKLSKKPKIYFSASISNDSIQYKDAPSNSILKQFPHTPLPLKTSGEAALIPQHQHLFALYQTNTSQSLWSKQILPKTQYRPLATLKPISHKQAWGDLQKNKSVEGNPLTVQNIVFKHGLGMHSPSKTTYDLKGQFNTFSTYIGLDEESVCQDGVSFLLLADGIEIKKQHINYHEIGYFEINVKNVKKLTLQTLSLQNKDCDHTNWLNPILE